MADAVPASGAGAQQPARADVLRPVLIGCVLAGTFMQVLDSTVANVALPYMQGSLQAAPDQITWVLTSYVLAVAVMTAPVGWLAGRFGRRNLYVAALTGFTLASAACGAATSLNEMVFLRALQGVFGASLAPLSQSMMFDLYPPQKRGTAMSIYGSVIMVGPILGPTFGGYLTNALSWRWVFYINVPVGIAAALGILLFNSKGVRDHASRFDWMAFGFLSLGLATLQLVLDRGTTQGWFESTEIWIESIISVLGFYLFIVHLLTSDSDFVPRDLLRDRNYTAGFLFTFIVGLQLMAGSAMLPQYLENLAGYPVVDTGMFMIPRGVGTVISMLLVLRNSARVDARIMMGIGVLLMAWSFWVMSLWTPAVGSAAIIFWMFFQGIAMGFLFAPANLIAFATLPANMRTAGSAFMALVRNVGGGIGISISSVLIAWSTQVAHAGMAGHVSPFNRALDFGAPAMQWNRTIPSGLSQLDGIIARQAQIIAYSNTFLCLCALCFSGILGVLLMHKVPGGGGNMSEAASEAA